MPELTAYLNPVKIDIKNDDGLVGATMHLNELKFTYKDKQGSPCNIYADKEDDGKWTFGIW